MQIFENCGNISIPSFKFLKHQWKIHTFSELKLCLSNHVYLCYLKECFIFLVLFSSGDYALDQTFLL